jgi:hypothetical protein
MNGRGYLKLKDGSYYEGEFKNGKPHGRGLYKNENITYEGEFS